MGNVPPSFMTELKTVNSPGGTKFVVVVEVIADPAHAEIMLRLMIAPAKRNRRRCRAGKFTSFTVVSQSKKRLGIT